MTLIYTVDHLSREGMNCEAETADIIASKPLCIRMANFYEPVLRLLVRIPKGSIVAWKIEYMGEETPHHFLKSSRVVDVREYVRSVQSLGLRLVPYTFTDYNRWRIYETIPEMGATPIQVVPLAQKTPVAVHEEREVLRARIAPEAEAEATLYGVAGLLSPTKGIDELVERFVETAAENDYLVCSLLRPGKNAEDVRSSWARRFGMKRIRRIYVHVGAYGDWSWMCQFYSALDVALVNSVHESWGRCVSEPLGLGRSTVVRRARCSTNFIAPSLTLIDSFDFASLKFKASVKLAGVRAPWLARYVNDRYSPECIRARFIDNVVAPVCNSRESKQLKAELTSEEGKLTVYHAITGPGKPPVSLS